MHIIDYEQLQKLAWDGVPASKLHKIIDFLVQKNKLLIIRI